VLHVAALPPSRGAALRLVALLPHDEVPGWLDAIGWPGSPRQLAEALALTGGPSSQAQLQLDLGETVGFRWAVEFYSPALPRNTAAWSGLVEGLVARGLCGTDKGKEVLAWIGGETERLPGTRRFVHLVRSLFIKLAAGRDRSWEAKAYLGFHPAPLIA
jgi:hypothetical protein